MKTNFLATIVMPVYNGATTLREVFESLENQDNKEFIEQIILINDNSSDDSQKILNDYKAKSTYKCKIIHNNPNIGLANGYNQGIKLSNTDFVITMHQDIVLNDLDSFGKILKPLLNDDTLAASYPVLDHPKEVWDTYNFWQKAMFSRFVNKKIPLLSGKFDAFRIKALKEINYFNSDRYRTAGEDGDLKRKFQIKGYKTVDSQLEVVHIHNREKNFSLAKYIKKDVQIAEAQGVILRTYGIESFINFIAAFFRQILVIGLFVPYVNFLSALLIICYSIFYGQNVLKEKKGGYKLFLLPLINIYILFLSTFYSFKGFITSRQKL